LIGEDAPIDLALVPIGDRFTMGPKDAAKAVSYLAAKSVVPIHYGTFPGLVDNPNEFVALASETGAQVHALQPGATVEF